MRILFLNFEFGMRATKGYWQMPMFWRYFGYPNAVKQVAEFMKAEDITLAGFTEINFPKQAELFEKATEMNSAGRIIYQSRFTPFIRQGNLLLSYYPINEYSLIPLPGKGQPRAVVKASVETPKGTINVLLTHLGLGKSARRAQIDVLNSLCLTMETPLVIMGDFNSFDWENELRPLLENKKIQHADVGSTHPSWNPTHHIDHMFFSRDFRINEAEAYLKEKFSDHAALIADIN